MTYQCTGCSSEYAAPLVSCPRCTAFGKEGSIVPKATTGGASNAHEPESTAPVAEEAVEAGVSDAPGAEEGVREDAGGQDPAGTGPARPASAAPKAAWVAWAVECGLDQADAEAMTKAALQAWEPPMPGDEGTEPSVATTLTITAEAEVTPGGDA